MATLAVVSVFAIGGTTAWLTESSAPGLVSSYEPTVSTPTHSPPAIARAHVAPLHQDPAPPTGLRNIVWQRALTARKCAIRHGQISPSARMAIIDYDLPSSRERLWIVDPSRDRLVLSDLVAHGSGSGELMAKSFSNREGSYQSSLGVFRVAESYQGAHGSSLRMDGLEAGFNDQARNRSIVLHSAWYAEPGVIRQTGRLGRSQGCPAVRAKILRQVEQSLEGGGLLFAHASQPQWLSRSTYLNCS